jgi:predicted ATPase
MWISEIDLKCIKSFHEAHLNLSKEINIIIGSNNCGKSTILQSALSLQDFQYSSISVRLNEDAGIASLRVREINTYIKRVLPQINESEGGFIETIINRYGAIQVSVQDLNKAHMQDWQSFPNLSPATEPHNLIYPYLSKRKVTQFSELINKSETNAVTGELSRLYPKVDRLTNPSVPAHESYMNACRDILNFEITSTPSDGGKKAALIVNNQDSISIDSMGEGVSNLLGLIVDLCIAENQVFLIEEPENDVHPKALKKLLELIVEKSKTNQFLITTHSNIVLKYLGAQTSSKIFQVSMELIDRLPTSKVREVENTPEERQAVLEDLGYEFFDIDFWSAWLILEESSAEKIIREYLIDWFVPELKGKLRTFSAHSLSEVELKFDDFNRLFVFLHLQSIYKNRAWVLVDEGEQESEVIQKLKDKYCSSGWSEESFLQLSEHDFEKYYPEVFREDIEIILGESNKQKKRAKKKALLEKVEVWIKEDENRAKIAFEKSASEVIMILKKILSEIHT